MGQLSNETAGVSQGNVMTGANSESSGHSGGVRSAVLVWSGKSSWGRKYLSWGLKAQRQLD